MIVFDRGAERVVCLNPGKSAIDLARRWELGSLEDIRKRGDVGSGIGIHWRAGFLPKRKGVCQIAEFRLSQKLFVCQYASLSFYLSIQSREPYP
jgi:hypothetical protein